MHRVPGASEVNQRAAFIATLAAGLLIGGSTDGAERAGRRFAPRATTIVGTDATVTRAPFTRVWTQAEGELAIERVSGRYVNLSIDFPRMLQRFREEEEPVVAYTSVSWADELLRIVCFIDKSRSSLLQLRFRIVLRVTEGSLGSVVPGTDFGETEFRIFFDDGDLVMTSDFEFSSGILPELLPTNWTMSEHVLPDSWLTFRPGEIVAEHTFTSVAPPDGGEPRVHRVVERFTVGDRASRPIQGGFGDRGR